jgi:hypothetical protein
MNFFRPLPVFAAMALVGLASVCFVRGADPVAPLSASEIASRLTAQQQDGTSYIRLRMETKGPTPAVLQLQIKQRITKSSSEIVYQVLFPKERKGESVLLKRSGKGAASGSLFTPPNTVKPIGDMKAPMLGGDLSYEDIIENFFGWDQQAIVGNEAVDGVSCQILESKPGKGNNSNYGSVRSWIDTKRMVPLRVEKYSESGKLVRRIDTAKVVADGSHHIPADLVVHGPRADSTTTLDGSRIKHDVSYTDADFSPDGLKEMTVPRGSSE